MDRTVPRWPVASLVYGRFCDERVKSIREVPALEVRVATVERDRGEPRHGRVEIGIERVIESDPTDPPIAVGDVHLDLATSIISSAIGAVLAALV